MMFGWRPKLDKNRGVTPPNGQQPKHVIPITLKYVKEPEPCAELVPHKDSKR